MKHYKYLIIGGGMAADEAAKSIRAADPGGSLGMISAEANPPYDRPPLTKALWKDASVDEVWRHTDELEIDMYLGRKVQNLDATRKRVSDDQTDVYSYEELLLATGGSPRQLPFEHNPDEIIYYRTLKDYERLAELTAHKRRFAIIGGGFIGSELAAALTMNDKNVTMIFPEQGIGGSVFIAEHAQFLNDYYRDRGVRILNGRLVQGVKREGDEFRISLDDQSTVEAEVVVAGLGIEPNTELAKAAGLEVNDGIVVDQFLRTSKPHIYAAGDVAVFPDPIVGKRRRVEHEDNAVQMGKLAGQAMAGDPKPYDYSPYFYSDLFDLGYEAVGELASERDTVADWQDGFEKGVVYYLNDGRVTGVLLWNVWDQVGAARELIGEPGPVHASDLIGRLPAA